METRPLTSSNTFAAAAEAWAKTKTILDSSGNIIVRFPSIIGMPDGSTDLGAFNIGLIQNNRTVKQALQDLETTVNGRMLGSSNLSDLTNKATARTNLELGNSVTWNVGTSGAVIPLLNTVNTWSGVQSFVAGTSVAGNLVISSGSGVNSTSAYRKDALDRWVLGKSSTAESGSNAGADFFINRYNDAGTYIDTPFGITRSTGIVSLSQPLPVTSGGTGVNSLTTLKTNMALNNVSNTSDAAKPISTATQTALDLKFDKAGGVIGGNIVINGTTTLAIFKNVGSSQTSDVWYTNTAASSSAVGYNRFLYGNENSVAIASIENNIWTDGSSSFDFYVTPAGSRASDRRIDVLTVGSSAITAQVPINGRAYPRRSDGSDVNFNWTGQSGQPSWVWGSNNGTDVYPYNPNNFTVSAVNPPLITGTNEANLVSAQMADNDFFRIRVGGSASNSGWVEFATADDGNEPIYFRQYAGAFTGSSRTLTLMDANGATILPTGLWAPYTEIGGNIWVNQGNTAGKGIILSDDGDIVDLNDTYCSMRFTAGVRIYSGNKSGTPAITLSNSGSISGTEHYAVGWFRSTGDNGLYWDARGRGISSPEQASATYGHISTYGSGMNGWHGYSIFNYATFMASSSQAGIHSPQLGDWLFYCNLSNGDATFRGNITAYSDERLKFNKRPIDNVSKRREGMAKAAILYERNGETRVGFGAQTLEPAVPEVVKTSDDLVGTKSVNYGDLVAVLAVDNQNLSDKIDSLESEVTELKSIVSDLIARLNRNGL